MKQNQFIQTKQKRRNLLWPIVMLLASMLWTQLLLPRETNAQIPSTLGWYEIPNTKLRAVCPPTSTYSQIQGNTGCAAVMGAWSGGSFDTAGNRLIMLGGGHADYAGNELYALDLNTLKMTRLNNPSTTVRDGCTSAGTYGDGTPVARHWYNHLEYLPNQNAVFAWGGSQWLCGGFSGQTWLFDLATLTWMQKTSTNGPKSGYGRAVAYDANSGLVYARDDYDLLSFNPAANTWTKRSSTQVGMSDSKTGLIDPVRKKYFIHTDLTGARLYWYDISSTTASVTLQSGTTSGCSGFIGNYGAGWAFDPVQNRIVGWNGGSTVYILNPDTLTCTTVSHSGGPTAEPNGTFGRFRYSPSLNVFVACNMVDSNCYTLRLTSGTGTPPPPPTTFDFALAIGGNKSVTQGLSTSNAITATLVSGTSQSASFSASGFPTGTTGAFTQTTCSPTCSSTLNISTAPSTPAGSYTVTVSASAGALTRTSSFVLTVGNSTTTPPPTGSADFQTRCSQPGVLKCVSFDSQADITGTYGDVSGLLPGSNSTAVLDSSIKASGTSSLKFTIPSNSGSDSSGTYFTNFSNNLSTQFGQNSEFYIQWRQRFSPEFISTNYLGGGGWKQVIVGTGDKPGCTSSQSASGLCYSSCSDLETVVQNTYQQGFPQMYNSCSGSASHGPYDGFTQPYGSYDFKLQNGRPAPYCLYSQGQTTPQSYFPPAGNCFGYFANEWMTFQMRIKTGPRVNNEFTNSYVQLWIARENKPSELVINWGPYNLTAGSTATDQKFGKIWLLPYHTGKSSSQSHPTAYTWYDELVIATSKIADPAASGGGTVPTPPAAPTGLVVK